MSKIIVGVDASAGAKDAICLASNLAGITGARLMLVNVFPYDQHPSRAVNSAFEQYLRQDSVELLEALRSRLDDETVAVRAVPNTSPAHGLDTIAEREDAGLIVVGSTHIARIGRVRPGSTAERLLHGAPCPVAVAPKGYRAHDAKTPTTIGCGFDGSPSSQRALEAARGLAAATGAHLRVIRAFRPAGSDIAAKGVPFGGIAAYNDDLADRAHDELHAAVGELGLAGADGELVIGDAERVLADRSQDLDLLVVGSRGYGPMHAVIVGGVVGRLMREAACPVIVFPRGAGHTGADSLFVTAASVQG